MRNYWHSVKRSDLYQRVKSSWLYDAYWNVVDRRIVEDRRSETAFYYNLLVGFRMNDLILDIGANEGYKTSIFLRLGARVVMVEPDSESQTILRQRFLKYRIAKAPVVLVPKAASDIHSVQQMLIDEPGSAKNTLSSKWAETLRKDSGRFGKHLEFAGHYTVETLTVDELIAEYGLPYFIKIDVEGYEINVIRGLSQPVPYLSFEVNLPEFREEGIKCVRLLERLAPAGLFNYTADCRAGMALGSWVGASETVNQLALCNSQSIEVFWKTV